MRRLFVLPALLLATPLAAQSFSGCGATYGTCASVTIAAVPQSDGTWAVTMTVFNVSQNRTSMIDELAMTWATDDWNSGRVNNGFTVTDRNGTSIGSNFSPVDGRGYAGFSGYLERSDNDGTVIWSQYAGAESPDCEADPACVARRWSAPPGSAELVYYSGSITYRFNVTDYDPANLSIEVRQNFIDGNRAVEFYTLAPMPVTTTPEPVTLTLLASGLAGVGLVRRRRYRAVRRFPAPKDQRKPSGAA